MEWNDQSFMNFEMANGELWEFESTPGGYYEAQIDNGTGYLWSSEQYSVPGMYDVLPPVNFAT